MSSSNVEMRPPESAGAAPTQLRLGLSLSAITALQIVTAFGIQWYTVYVLGAGANVDALYGALTLPQILAVVLIDNLRSVLVPWFAGVSRERRDDSVWILVLVAAGFGVLVAVLLGGLAAGAMGVLVPGFDVDTLSLAVRMCRIVVWGIPLASVVAVLAAYQQARHRFVRVAAFVFLGVAAGAAVLATRLRGDGIVLAAWVQVGVHTLPALFLLLGLPRLRFEHLQWNVCSEVWSRLRPVLLGGVVYRTGFVVDRWLASFLLPGSLAILDLVQRGLGAMVRTLNQGVVTPIVPHLVEDLRKRGLDSFRRRLGSRLRLSFFAGGIVVAAMLVFAFLAREAAGGVGMGSQVGALGASDFRRIFEVAILGGGIVLFGSAAHALTMGFYAMDDTRTPTRIGVAAYACGLVLRVVGFYVGGIRGIAAATSVFYLIQFVGLRWALRRRFADLDATVEDNASPHEAGEGECGSSL